MDESPFASRLQAQFSDLIAPPTHFRGETTVVIKDASRIQEVCRFAKDDLGFDYLVDITSLDDYGESPRFTVVYELYSYAHRTHLRLKTPVDEEKAELPSVIEVWKGADWLEREVYDMMGIRFVGHPDLRRLLMWEGYPYFPLRKDFPLAGRPTDLPEVAFTEVAPEEGGPFVTPAGPVTSVHREPRARTPDRLSKESAT